MLCVMGNIPPVAATFASLLIRTHVLHAVFTLPSGILSPLSRCCVCSFAACARVSAFRRERKEEHTREGGGREAAGDERAGASSEETQGASRARTRRIERDVARTRLPAMPNNRTPLSGTREPFGREA